MNGRHALRILRRSPGRLRVHAPLLTDDGGRRAARIAAAAGIRTMQPNELTGNVLIEFDDALIAEASVLALLVDSRRGEQTSDSISTAGRAAPAPPGWLQAQTAATIAATPADCVSALVDFERYPEWQAFVMDVSVLERDRHGRGIRVVTNARMGERDHDRYRYPTPNRVAFEQEDGQLEAVRGRWMIRSIGGGRTRATFVLEVRPGRRLSLLLRGPMVDQAREAVVDHFMRELRERAERASESSSSTQVPH